MNCQLCNCEDISVIYNGPVRTGKRDGYTEKSYPVYQCNRCKTIWNYSSKDYPADYYESKEYRTRIEQDASVEQYYALHDEETLFKLNITGTAIFRNKIVADIGCAGGSFLDYLNGVCKDIIAIEPSKEYQKTLCKKYHTYSYASDAMADWANKVDIVTNFDVIEHVPSPYDFLKDCYDLLKEGGEVCIGTPTDYPVLRKMLGDTFNKFVFSIHHPWVLSEEIMREMAEKIGFKAIEVYSIQRFGLGNLLSWLLEKEPRGDVQYDFITDTLNAAYKEEAVAKGNGEYIVLKAKK